MPVTKLSSVDDYISNSQPFAIPVLKQLRRVIHKACPGVKETIKWNCPHFEYHGILCSFASFKSHCAFTIRNAELIRDKNHLLETGQHKSAMGNFGKLASTKDLPDEALLIDFLRQAMEINEMKLKSPQKKIIKPRELQLPDELKTRLKKHKSISDKFNALSYSHKKEYIQWISSAKKAETRHRRIEKMIEMLSQ